MKIAYLSSNSSVYTFRNEPEQLIGVLIDLYQINCFDAKSDLSQLYDYDVLIILIFMPYYDVTLIERLRKLYPKKKIILLYDGDCNFIQSGDMSRREIYLRALSLCDGLVVYSDCKKKYFQNFINKPILSLRNANLQCERIKQEVWQTDKIKAIFVNGKIGTRWNGLTSYILAGELAKRFDYNIVINCHSEITEEEFKEYVFIAERFNLKIPTIIPVLKWYPDYLSELSKYKLAINMDSRVIGGRFTSDCALVGTPCIGPMNLDYQREYFPSLTTDNAFNICAALEKAAAVLNMDYNNYNNLRESAFMSKMLYSQKDLEHRCNNFFIEIVNN